MRFRRQTIETTSVKDALVGGALAVPDDQDVRKEAHERDVQVRGVHVARRRRVFLCTGRLSGLFIARECPSRRPHHFAVVLLRVAHTAPVLVPERQQQDLHVSVTQHEHKEQKTPPPTVARTFRRLLTYELLTVK